MGENYYDIMMADCHAADAYNFTLTKKSRIGYITAMSFTTGGKTLVADTPINNPEAPDAKLQVVAVLDRIDWDGDPTSSFKFTGRLSPKNKGIMKDALSSLKGGADVDIKFAIIEYDFDAKKYYQCLHSDGKDLKYIITHKTKAELQPDPATDITIPPNYIFSISLTPKSKGGKQEVMYASSAESKLTLEIGCNVT